jgi:hypothetical protein
LIKYSQLQVGPPLRPIPAACSLNALIADNYFTDDAQANEGVSASVDDPKAICQAFSDTAATKTLGQPFKFGTDSSFTNASDGGVDSNADDAVPIGAFLCSDSLAKLQQESGGKSSSESGNQTGSGATIRVQVESDFDTFVQADVPVGKLVLTGIL